MKLLRTPIEELPYGPDRRILAELRGERRKLPEPAPTKPLPPLPPCSLAPVGLNEEPLDRFLNGIKGDDDKAISPLEALTLRARKAYEFETGKTSPETAKASSTIVKIRALPPGDRRKIRDFEQYLERELEQKIHKAWRECDPSRTALTSGRLINEIIAKVGRWKKDNAGDAPRKAVGRYLNKVDIFQALKTMFPHGMPNDIVGIDYSAIKEKMRALGLRSAQKDELEAFVKRVHRLSR
jgi:hypothetical protein